MKTNNLLTYLLYALLAALILAAGYKACQMQDDKKKQAAEEAELQKTLRDLGYAHDDSLAQGSSYGGDTTSTTTSTVTSSGIETDPVAPKKNDPKTTSSTAAKTTASTVATITKTTATTPKTTTTTPKTTTLTTSTTATSSKGANAVKGPGTGRWAVRAGTFSVMEGARRRLEEVIRMGYSSAEISKTSTGKAAVVVFRSNDKNAAIRVVDKLEEKGIDAAVFDRNKKD